jgi:alpha-beta hydrolase superfamily lysophospholipase
MNADAGSKQPAYCNSLSHYADVLASLFEIVIQRRRNTMLNRRELLLTVGFTAGGLLCGSAAPAAQKPTKPKLATVTLAITGMT